MLAARLPGNSTYDNLRQAGPPDTGGCLIPHSSLTARHQERHISLIPVMFAWQRHKPISRW